MIDLAHFAPSLEAFERAASAIAGDILETPLLPLGGTLFAKAENLQPLGSFKIRAGANALSVVAEAAAGTTIATASAGNFAQGLALAARRRGMNLVVHAPDTAPEVKCAAIAQLGAKIIRHEYATWWEIMRTRDTGVDGEFFIHPVADPAVMVGNGTIALELARQAPECEEIYVPFGGGGLICGIALAMRALGRRPKIIACEVETAAPLRASFDAGRAITITRTPSFVDGIGGQSVLEEMWPLLRACVDDVAVVPLSDVADAVASLWRDNRIVAEGAGATSVAAARGRSGSGRAVAIVSGGNIDWPAFKTILEVA